VIILDTHVWVWWMDGGAQLPNDYQALIQAESPTGLGICAISCGAIPGAIWDAEDDELLGAIRWQLQQLNSPIAAAGAESTAGMAERGNP
jgi:hypothetical protein